MELRLLKFICFVLMHINIEVGNSWRFDYTYIKNANGSFKFHRTPAPWEDARMRCHFEGAVLVTPYPQKIYESLLTFMQKINNAKYNIFTGLHASFSPGDYQTVDGTSLAEIPLKWMDSEPDNKDNDENCLIMSSEGFAADVKCTESHPYICYKKKMEGGTNQNPCGTTDRGTIEWVPTTPENAHTLIERAVVAGYEGHDGSPLWVIRARVNGDLIPGKLAINHRTAYIPQEGKEIPVNDIEVCYAHPEKIKWVHTRDCVTVPPNAVVAGYTSSGEPLYVGRAKEEGALTPGKVVPSHKSLYISFAGRELVFKAYEVLCTV